MTHQTSYPQRPSKMLIIQERWPSRIKIIPQYVLIICINNTKVVNNILLIFHYDWVRCRLNWEVFHKITTVFHTWSFLWPISGILTISCISTGVLVFYNDLPVIKITDLLSLNRHLYLAERERERERERVLVPLEFFAQMETSLSPMESSIFRFMLCANGCCLWKLYGL